MTARRTNLAAGLDDTDDVTAPKPRLEQAEVERLAQTHGFHSREPQTSTPRQQQRRYTTGRNVQVNVKATAETVALFHALSDRLGVPQGEVLARALQELQKTIE